MIDLHIHSTFSDGTDTPQQIINQAKQLGLKQISITDHNSLEGILQALQYVDDDIDFIIVIELSCMYHHREIHLLGYFDSHQRDFQSVNHFITLSESYKKESQFQMIDLLKQQGIDISYQQLQQKFPHTIINRVHIAHLLVEKGWAKDVNEAFDTYIAEGKPCFVQKKCQSIYEGIEAIHQCHGYAVLAHPWLYTKDHMEAYLQDALASSLDGLECIHSRHTLLQQEELIAIALKYHKMITGGSDYHGSVKKDVSLGCMHVSDQYQIQ